MEPVVLVIDDDADYSASVRALLEAEGYRVVVAASGHEGLERIQQERPDLIVLDVMMESTTEGYLVNQLVKYSDSYERCHDVPIVMVSSIEQTPDELYPRAGEVELIRPDRYLTKPLDLPRFLQVVREALASHSHRS